MVTVTVLQARIKGRLSTDPGFLAPEYRGTSEEYAAEVRVASAALSLDQVKAINDVAESRGVSEAMVNLVTLTAEASGVPKYSNDLADKVLAEAGSFSREMAASANRRWALRLAAPVPEVVVTSVMPKVDRIAGDARNITVRWRE